MSETIDPASQRLFRFAGGRFVLIAKSGRAVAFRVDANGDPEVIERMDEVDFKATGDLLIAGGWHCIGPGLEYAVLLAAPERPGGPDREDDGGS